MITVLSSLCCKHACFNYVFIRRPNYWTQSQSPSRHGVLFLKSRYVTEKQDALKCSGSITALAIVHWLSRSDGTNSLQLMPNCCDYRTVSFIQTVLVVAEEKVVLGEPPFDDVHALTGSLKLYFRELPEPLIPYDFFSGFVEAISKLKTLSKPVNATHIKQTASCFPPFF